jgi:hypothetical protein
MTEKDIKYINKDFSGFKKALVDYAKNYFPDIYNDFTEASPGNMLIEMASYVGDVLSFYIDKQTQENLLLFAQDKQNLISLAYSLGYRPKVTSTSIVEMDVFQQIPAFVSGGVSYPDYSYCLIINKEAKIKATTQNAPLFVTEDLVDFSFSSSSDPTNITVHSINQSTGQPEYYTLRKKVKAIAGTISTAEFTFSNPEKFSSIELPETNVIQILDVTDSDGNKWFEVPYLAQSTVFLEQKNNSLNDPVLSEYADTTPYLLRLKKVSRRFVTRFNTNNRLVLEFGSGVLTNPDEEIIPNSDNVGMGVIDSISKMTMAYDPSNFIHTKDYGLAPSNTTLTVRYLVGGGSETNVPSNTITNLFEINTKTVSLTPTSLNQNLLTYIISTVGFNNQNPSSGGGSGDTVEDIRLKTIANFPTQLRNVTKDDHVIRALSMPPKFGTVAKAYMAQDMSFNANNTTDFINSNPLSLSMYVLSFDANKKLVNSSFGVKNNLRNYLGIYKITTDAINIKDAYYINIGVNFDVVVLPSYNNREILSQCIDLFKEYFNIDKWQINQPIILSELYSLVLCKVPGVQTVSKIEIVNKYGLSAGYSPYAYDIKGATKNNVIYPSVDPSIFEVRYPDNDIYGRVINFS